MSTLTLDDVHELGTVEVTIDGLGFQGEGWVRLADGWLSVRGALPGERVVCTLQPTRWRSRRVWATLDHVVTPAERRGDPQCDAFPGCRGCQLRHVAVFDELGIKAQTVADCIARYAELPHDEQPEIETIAITGASRADAHRVRTNLTVRWDGDATGAWKIGLRADDALVSMVHCPALTDSVKRAVARFEQALQRVPPTDAKLHGARIAVPVHGHGYVDLLVERDVDLDPLTAALDALYPPNFGIAVTADGAGRRHVRGPQRIRLPMADLRLEVGFDDWFHATLEPAEVLYDAVEEWLAVRPGERVLDAGCGVGTIGLVCASRGADVVGFDINTSSVETAELNALNNGLDVEFMAGAWEKALCALTLQRRTFDTVVINPMRDPLGRRALAYVPMLNAKRVLYLGPSAAPASKDIGTLRSLGYQVDRLGAVNLHPATYHVMVAALLSRP